MKAKIGFLPLNWDVWDADNWGEKLRDRCVAVLESIEGIELVVPSKELTAAGCLREDNKDAKKVAELFIDEDVQGLLVGNMNFGVEVALGNVLDCLHKDIPVMHFTTRSGPYSPVNGRRTTDTWCGSLMCASAIRRRGFNYVHVNSCFPEDEYFKKNVDTFARAVCAISNFKGARFLQVGTRPRLFECQAYSEQALQHKFAQRIEFVDVDTLFGMMESYSENDSTIKEIMENIESTTNIVESADDTLVNMARFELALETLKEKYGCSAIGAHCWTRLQDRFHIAACSVFGRLNKKGIITACEVDTLGAISMWAMYCAGFGKIVPDFIDFTDLHPDGENAWLAWHCGNAATCLCADGCKPTLQTNIQLDQLDKGMGDPAEKTNHGCSWFRLKEGPVTAGRIVEYDGEYTMFFGNGVIEDMKPRTTGSYGWVRVKDVMDWETKMFEAGIVHHGVIMHDPAVADAMELFCRFLGIKAVRGE